MGLVQPSADELLPLALEMHGQGRSLDAIRICREIIESAPDHAEALHTLGSLECGRKRWQEALGRFRRAVSLQPGEARYRAGAAIALWKLGQREEAIAEVEGGLAYSPDDVELRLDRAKFLTKIRDPVRALQAVDEAIVVAPDPSDLMAQAARILSDLGRFRASEQRWRQILARNPHDGAATIALAGELNHQGLVEEALPYFRAAASMPEVGGAARQGLLLSLHYSDRETPRSIFGEHRTWGRRVEGRPAPRAPAIRARRVLRIGYVSGDFRRHSVAHFFEPLLANHDASAVETHCFSNHSKADGMTARLRGMAQGWHDIGRLPDDAAAHAIRKANIDILVDLSGHTAHNRLAVFARKPAPIQVTYLGYPDTTGLRAIDYRFTDSIADPPGETEHLHSEKLVRLDPCFLCYRPWLARLPVGPPPYEANGFVTLASLAIREKLSPTTLEAWAAILRRVPRARLLVKCRAMADPDARQRMLQFFRGRGVSERRLILTGTVRSTKQHLEWYHQADLMLDPYPYNGTTITCEGLWMGVPTVTWCGRTHVSRVGASVLTQVSMQEVIADSADEYVEKTVEVLRAKGRLTAWRRDLRRRMRSSPLMDGGRLAHAVETAYREMWRA